MFWAKGEENVCFYGMCIFIQKNPVEILVRFSMESIYFQKAFCMAQQSQRSAMKGKQLSISAFVHTCMCLSVHKHHM